MHEGIAMNRLLMALAILMMTVVSTLGLAGQASAAPTSGDPLSTGCANGAQTIWQQQVLAPLIHGA